MSPKKHKQTDDSKNFEKSSDSDTESSSDADQHVKKKVRKYSISENENDASTKSKSKKYSDSDNERHNKTSRKSVDNEEVQMSRNSDRPVEDEHRSRRSRDEGRERHRVDQGRDEERYSRTKRDYHRDDRREYRGDRRGEYQRDPNDNRRDRRNDYNERNYRNRGRFDRRDREDNYRRRRSRSASFDHSSAKWGRHADNDHRDEKKTVTDKQKPNFSLSGKLTEETNTYRGVVIKYSEPPEARKPKRRWRLYPFKGEKALQTLYIHRDSAYLIGRDRKVVDLPIDHPSCSKQHAALQYRLVPFTRDDGTVGKRVRPYLIDLESANGTYINNKRIEPKKYVELLERDVIKFGYSSREYVLLHENSKDETMDDDVKQEIEEEPIVKPEVKEETE